MQRQVLMEELGGVIKQIPEDQRAALTEKLLKNAEDGLNAGGVAAKYRQQTDAQRQADNTVMGIIQSSFSGIAGLLGGWTQWIWQIAEKTPLVGELVTSTHDWISGKKAEDRAKETANAGIADGLGLAVDGKGVTVSVEAGTLGRIYRRLQAMKEGEREAPPPSAPATPVTPDAPAAAPSAAAPDTPPLAEAATAPAAAPAGAASAAAPTPPSAASPTPETATPAAAAANSGASYKPTAADRANLSYLSPTKLPTTLVARDGLTHA